MKIIIQRILTVLFTQCAFISLLQAQAPIFEAVATNSPQIPIYGKFELSMRITAAYTNPYDYNQVRVHCKFKSPSGNFYEVDGFYMQDYSLFQNGSITAFGNGDFRLRFAPFETGNWEYTLSCTTPGGTTSKPTEILQCLAGTTPGFVRKNSTNYLGFDNGTQYIPIGENMGWHNTNIHDDYLNWLNDLKNNKGNFIRLWMPDWSMGFEWKNGSNGFEGLLKYKQSSAFYLDWLMDQCRQRDIYVMLCLNHHGQVSTQVNPQWNDNPYNRANGGPCVNTWHFFSNDSARMVLKNRLRYIVARYGYSTNIMSWELFNEVEWTDDFNAHRDSITIWHDEMAKYIKSLDVYKHLVTTSYALDAEDRDTWNLPSIDFTQTHYYVNTPNLETVVHAGHADYLNHFNKPTLNGEFGLGPAGQQLSTMDPNGIHIHNTIWATAFSGAMGPAMTWWWDNYIEPRNLYYHYKPLSELLATLQLKNENYVRDTAIITGGGQGDLTISPGAGWSAATADSITVTSSGINPGSNQLGSFLYGSQWNTQFRKPPVFKVNYPVAGQFRVTTGGTTGTAPKVNIYLDGSLLLNQDAQINTVYSINVPAGAHHIKVDNPGTDWITVSSYVFTNIGSPLNTYMLRTNDGTKMAGWIHNVRYNYKYLQDNITPPPAVNGANIHIGDMQNGQYRVVLSSCSTGAPLDTIIATVTAHMLNVPLPAINWDMAIVATQSSVTAIPDLPLAKQLKVYPNPVTTGDLYVEFDLERPTSVSLQLFDLLGRPVKTLHKAMQQSPGLHKLHYATASLVASTGVYLLKVQIGNDHFIQKLFVVKDN